VYFGGETFIHFDPRYVQNLNDNPIPEDQKPFINARIGGTLIDFDDFVTNEDSYSAYTRNTVKGRVGDQNPSHNNSISMLWNTGNAQVLDWQALTCSYDNSTCYHAKTVPVIKQVSSHNGYTTGGQHLTIIGWGFNSPNITAIVDGVPCKVIKYQKDQFTCEIGIA